MLVGIALGFGLAAVLGGLGYWRLRVRQATEHTAAIARAERAERLAAASDPVIALTADGLIADLNASAARLLAAGGGARPASLTALVHPDDRDRVARLLDPVAAAERRAEVVRLRAAGDWRTWEIASVTAPAAEQTAAAAGALLLRLRDVGEREALRAELATNRLYDPTTGLPTPALFHDRLAHALALAARRAEAVGIFLVDPRLPDMVAEAPGTRDRLAVAIAQRVQVALRHGDSLARLDDGRFAILLETLPDVLDAAAVAERLLERFLPPVSEGGVRLLLAPEIGIALSGGHDRPDDVLLQAEAALGAVRRGNLAPYAVFDPSMSIAAVDEAGLESDLRRALTSGEVRLLYQPVARLDDNRIVAYEALPVWQHPHRGFVPTTDLLAIAEAIGMTMPLHQWSLVSVCRQLGAWQQAWPDGAPTVCLDLAPQPFRHPGLAGEVARLLHEVGLSPERLRLDIDQALALADAEATVTRLQALKEIGVQVAIDGFGTGYAALGFLWRCPVDFLKIGRSYVAGLGTNPDDSAIVKAALAFARGLEVPVVADGIETAAQRDALRRLGCAFGQGDLFGPPLPPDQLPTRGAATVPTAAGQPTDANGQAPSGSGEPTRDETR